MRNIQVSSGVAEALILLPASFFLWQQHGAYSRLALIAGLAAGVVIHHMFIVLMQRRLVREATTPADILTLGRAATGTVCLGLFTSGTKDDGAVAWLCCGGVLIIATLCDWLDGPLARIVGPTQLGAVLDIEADSWLTLWSACVVAGWGKLPWFVVVAPIIRYSLPIYALKHGQLPRGGGPTWSRVTGVAQMIMIITSLLPTSWSWLQQTLSVAAYPLSGAQCVAILVLLRREISSAKIRPPMKLAQKS